MVDTQDPPVIETQPSRLARVHAYLREKEQSVPENLDEFAAGMQDEGRRQRVYDYLKTQEDAAIPPTFADFSGGLFEGEAQKKSPNETGGAVSGTTSSGTFSPTGGPSIEVAPGVQVSPEVASQQYKQQVSNGLPTMPEVDLGAVEVSAKRLPPDPAEDDWAATTALKGAWNTAVDGVVGSVGNTAEFVGNATNMYLKAWDGILNNNEGSSRAGQSLSEVGKTVNQHAQLIRRGLQEPLSAQAQQDIFEHPNAQNIAAAGGSALGSLAPLLATGGAAAIPMAINEPMNAARNAGASGEEGVWLTLATAPVVALLDKIGFDKVAGGASGWLPSLVRRVMAKTGVEATEAGAKQTVAGLLREAAKATAVEGATEAGQVVYSEEVKALADALREGEKKYGVTQMNVAKQALLEGALGGAVGGSVNLAGGAAGRIGSRSQLAEVAPDTPDGPDVVEVEGKKYALPAEPSGPAFMATDRPAPSEPSKPTATLTASPIPSGFTAVLEARDPVVVLVNGKQTAATVTGVLPDGRVAVKPKADSSVSGSEGVRHFAVSAADVVAAPAERHVEANTAPVFETAPAEDAAERMMELSAEPSAAPVATSVDEQVSAGEPGRAEFSEFVRLITAEQNGEITAAEASQAAESLGITRELLKSQDFAATDTPEWLADTPTSVTPVADVSSEPASIDTSAPNTEQADTNVGQSELPANGIDPAYFLDRIDIAPNGKATTRVPLSRAEVAELQEFYRNNSEAVRQEAARRQSGTGDARATTQNQTAPYPGAQPFALGRIQPSAVASSSPQSTTSAALGLFRRQAGLTLRYSKSPGATAAGPRYRRRALGAYQPSNAVVTVRPRADLNTTAHEIGHFVDDQYHLLDKASAGAEAEMADLAQYGSAAPAGIADPAAYMQGEGLAEYIRARLVNPAEAAARYPELTALYDSAVPEKMRGQLEQLGEHIRAVGAASSGEQIRANIRWEPSKERTGVIGQLVNPRNSNGFGITALDRLAVKVTDSARIFEKAMRWAAQQNGKGEPRISRDPAVLARLFLGHVDKALSAMTNGLINARNERVKDAVTGQNLTLDFLYNAFTGTTAGDLELKARRTSELMIAQATVERYENGIRDQISEALDAGKTVDPELLASNPKYSGAPTTRVDDAGNPLTAQQANALNSGRRATIDLSEDEVLSGIGHGLYKDMDVARAALAQAEAARQRGDTDQAELDEAARRYRVVADANLRYLMDKGRYSEAQYAGVKARNDYYVAMQRVMDAEPDADLGIAQGRGRRAGLTGSNQLLNRAKGSGREIQNPYLSLTDAIAKSIREADRNDVLVAVTDLLTSDRQMYDGAPNQLGRVGHQVAEGTKDAVVVYRDGAKESWAFDDEVRAFLTDVERSAGSLPSWMRAPGALTRWTVTHSPQFLARNASRDVQDIVQISRHNPTLRDAARLATNKVERQQVDSDRALFGGGQAGNERLTEQEYYKAMQSALRKAAGEKDVTLLNPRSWRRGASALGSGLLHASEAQGRNLEYQAGFRKAKEDGLNDYEAGLYAAYHSRDILDFAVAGTWIRQLNQAVPFTNAAVQGTRRTLKAWTQQPGKTALRLLKYGILPAALNRLLIAAMGDDWENKYEDLPAYRRDFFFNLPSPTGGWIIVPKPFAMGVLGSLGDRALSSLGFGEEFDSKGVAGSLWKSLAPIDESAVFGGFKSLIEVITGKDTFRDKYIVSPYEEKLKVSLREGTKRASRLGQFAQGVTFDRLDARNADHLVAGYGTYFGQMVMGLSDIGRDDRQGLGLPSTGLYKDENAATGRAATDLQTRLNENGFGQSRTAKNLEDLISAVYDATTREQKDAAGQVLRGYTKRISEQLPDAEMERLKRADEPLPEIELTDQEQSIIDAQNPAVDE